MFKKKLDIFKKISEALQNISDKFNIIETLCRRVNQLENIHIDPATISPMTLSKLETSYHFATAQGDIALKYDYRDGLLTNEEDLIKVIVVDKKGETFTQRTKLKNLSKRELIFYSAYRFVIETPHCSMEQNHD